MKSTKKVEEKEITIYECEYCGYISECDESVKNCEKQCLCEHKKYSYQCWAYDDYYPHPYDNICEDTAEIQKICADCGKKIDQVNIPQIFQSNDGKIDKEKIEKVYKFIRSLDDKN